ncbi:MAG: hypothetical protein KC582_04875 [Candidatus Magasanikbacteria bacterium]|nr:hypothetical protein [Candidatus Magasanikbacteria bacterium]
MQRVSVNRLGRFLDGWSQLIEGKGDSAQAVRDNLAQRIRERTIPKLEITPIYGVSGRTALARPYILTKTHNGYTSAIFIESYGEDLYVSWRTFQKPLSLLNLILILIMLLVGVAFVWTIVTWLYRFYSLYISGFLLTFLWEGGMFYGSLIIQVIIFLSWIGTIFYLLFGEWDKPSSSKPSRIQQILGVLLIPLIIPILSLFRWMGSIAPSDSSLPINLFSFSVVPYVITLFIIVAAALTYKVWFKNSFSTTIFDSPTIFDADDAIALSLSVHKSLLHALDQVGIDTSQLRLHNETTQGRIGESV